MKFDADNFIKNVVDSLKIFVGDDKHVMTLIVRKRKLTGYDPADMDFLEQVVLIVTEERAAIEFNLSP